jgi:hypothetical protein
VALDSWEAWRKYNKEICEKAKAINELIEDSDGVANVTKSQLDGIFEIR